MSLLLPDMFIVKFFELILVNKDDLTFHKAQPAGFNSQQT